MERGNAKKETSIRDRRRAIIIIIIDVELVTREALSLSSSSRPNSRTLARRCGRILHARGVPERQGRVLVRVGEPRASPRRGYARLQPAAGLDRGDASM